MVEIIMQIPWEMDDGQLALASYWVQEDGGYTVDMFTDGDHEGVEDDEVPTAEQEQQAWRDYHQRCLQDGEDQLSQYTISYTETREVSWDIWISTRPGEGKVRFQKAREVTEQFQGSNDDWMEHHRSLPEYVRQYLCLEDATEHDAVVQGYEKIIDLERDVKESPETSKIYNYLGRTLIFRVKLEERRARDPEVVEGEICEKARHALDSPGIAAALLQAGEVGNA